MTKKVFDQIAEGLNEAVMVARGEIAPKTIWACSGRQKGGNHVDRSGVLDPDDDLVRLWDDLELAR